MRSFSYTVRDPLGIHARPAGLLVKLARSLDSRIEIAKGERRVGATHLLALMGLGIVCGDTVTVTVDGGDEVSSEQAVKSFFEKNL